MGRGGRLLAWLIVVVALLLPPESTAQTSRVGVVTTVHGTATVARAPRPEPTPLRFRDDVFVRDRIATGDGSIARILLGGKAVLTVRERSVLTITETAATSRVEVDRGRIALAVDKTRMKAGESVEIRTPNAVAGIRGTVIVAEVSAAGRAPATRFTLLSGVVDVTVVDPATGHVTGPPVILNPLQTLGVTGFSAPGAPRAISRAEADAIAADFSTGLRPPPTTTNQHLTDQQLQDVLRRMAAPGPRAGDASAARGDRGRGNGKKDDATDGTGGRAIMSDAGPGSAPDAPGDRGDVVRAVPGGAARTGGGIGGPGGGAALGNAADLGGDDVRARDRSRGRGGR
jgi:hypothetical protein